MFKRKSVTCLTILFAMSLMLFSGMVSAAETCLFVSESKNGFPDARDSSLIDYLEGKYTVDKVKGDDVKAGTVTIDSMKGYDFVFISESVSSGDGTPLRGNPVPIVTTEAYFAKQTVLGWAPDNNATGTYYGSTDSTDGGKVTIVDGDHVLAAGNATGAEVDIVTGTTGDSYLTFAVPGVDVAQIAVLTADTSKTIVMGVDKGTTLYNAAGVKDGSLVSEEKCALVGIHANANETITEAGFKLIQAGIDWVLTGPTEEWQATPITSQAGVFQADFKAQPTVDLIDAAIGLAPESPGGYGDLSTIVQFNNAGMVKVRDGGGYDALVDFPYTGGTTYDVKMVVDVFSQTYSVWIAEAGVAKAANGMTQIAENYAFRKEATSLNFLGTRTSFDAQWGGAVGEILVTNFTIGNPEDFINTAIDPQTGIFVAEFNAKPTADLVDGVLGLSQTKVADWGDFNIKLLFNNSGFITAANGGTYTSDTELAYTGNTTYAMKQLVNIPAQTYSLWVTPDGGTETLIAENYAFTNPADTLNYRTIKVSIGGKYGGADGFVEITNFTIENSEDFVNTAIDPQTGVFVAEFNATATADSVDGVLGLSQTKVAGWGDFNIKLLFNNKGFITAANGGTYTSDTELAYTGNTTYAIKQLVNIPAQTFSVWVTPQDGGAAKSAADEILLAEDYAFTNAADTLNYRTVKVSIGGKYGGNDGYVNITDFTIGNSEDFVNTAIDPQTGIFVAEFNATATADSVDGVLGLSQTKVAGWGDFNIKLLFNNKGFITAANGGTYMSDTEVPYTGNTTYAIKQLVNIPDTTFSVWVTPQDGGAAKSAADEILLAENYAFSNPADTLNYRTVKVSIGGKYGGADGFVNITDFTISDAPAEEEKLSCLFIRTSKPERLIWDAPMLAHLRETYDVTTVMDDSIVGGFFTVDMLMQHDFCFVSESVSDYKLVGASGDFLKLAPIPIFNGELYSAQPSINGWVSAEGLYGTISDSSGEGGKVLIVDETGHFLSAGFAYDAEVEITTDTDEEDDLGMITYCMPEIDYIPIAVSAEDPEKVVVFGVEPGTPHWDGLGLMIDPSLVNESRRAAVGLYSRSYSYITEDGYKLIDTGINWILGNDVVAVDDAVVQPVEYSLTQNYPNPFNPTTTISFGLKKSAHTTLTLHNVLGQVVATLIDNEMTVGAHHVTFEAQNIPSGIYFYRLQSGKFNQTRKMMLMK